MSIDSPQPQIDVIPNEEKKEGLFLSQIREMIETLEDDLEGMDMERELLRQAIDDRPSHIGKDAFDSEGERISKKEMVLLAKLDACARLLKLFAGEAPSEIVTGYEKEAIERPSY